MATSKLLDKRLLNYSLAAGALFNIGKTFANVNVTDNVNVTVNSGNSIYNIDFDQAGGDGPDIAISYRNYPGGPAILVRNYNDTENAAFIGQANGTIYFYPYALTSGQSIATNNPNWGARGDGDGTMAWYGTGGPWRGQSNRYLGVRFEISGQTHYGWVNMSVNLATDEATIHSFAYETDPNTGISAPLPVELTSFDALLDQNNKVELKWETATEVNNYGFEVERQYQVSSIENQDSSWEKIGFVQGHGTTNSPKSYTFVDSDPPDATEVSYRLKQIDIDGKFSYSKIVTVDLSSITGVEDQPKKFEFALGQNYPNPFNPATSIEYQVARREMVTLKVYDLLGREVATLVNELKAPGKYKINFDGSYLSSGEYIYKINVGNDFKSVKKMLLVK